MRRRQRLPLRLGYFAFVHNADLTPPRTFAPLRDVTSNRDPRRAVLYPGLGLLMWVKEAYGTRPPRSGKVSADNVVT